MKFTSETNLLKLIYRLVIFGIVIFIFAEILMVYVFAFYFLPLEKVAKLGDFHDAVRIGYEDQMHMPEKSDEQLSKLTSLTKLSDTYETYTGFKNNLFDVVKTDQLTARFLQQKLGAVPLAFLNDVMNDGPLRERVLLVTINERAKFFEDTKSFHLIIGKDLYDIDVLICNEFLKQRTESLDKWFSAVSYSINDESSLDLILEGKVDVAAVSEIKFKEYLNRRVKEAEKLRVLWYSNPLAKNVLMMRADLHEAQVNYLKKILKDNSDFKKFSWVLFENTLESLNKWHFTIRGENFEYPEKNLLKGNNK